MREAAPHGNLKKGTGTNLRRGPGRKRHESRLRPRHRARLQAAAFDAAPRFVAILNLRFRAPGATLARTYSPPSPDGGSARALTCRHRRTLKVAGGWALVFKCPRRAPDSPQFRDHPNIEVTHYARDRQTHDKIGVHHEEVRHRRLVLGALRRRVVRRRGRARHEARGRRGTRGRRGDRAAARTGQRASRAPPGVAHALRERPGARLAPGLPAVQNQARRPLLHRKPAQARSQGQSRR